MREGGRLLVRKMVARYMVDWGMDLDLDLDLKICLKEGSRSRRYRGGWMRRSRDTDTHDICFFEMRYQ